MDKLYSLIERSVLFQGVLVLGMTSAACYLWLTGRNVPDALVNILLVIVGFFFGSKAQYDADRAYMNKLNKECDNGG